MTRLPWPPDKEAGAEATPEQWMQMFKACDDDQLAYLIEHVLQVSRDAFACMMMDHRGAMYQVTHQLPALQIQLAVRERQYQQVQSVIRRWRTIDWEDSSMTPAMQALGDETMNQMADWLEAALQVPTDHAVIIDEDLVTEQTSEEPAAEHVPHVLDAAPPGVEAESS